MNETSSLSVASYANCARYVGPLGAAAATGAGGGAAAAAFGAEYETGSEGCDCETNRLN